jgi:phosphohistidine phosphatase
MLLLVHHAEAEAPQVDAMRPLTARGRAQAELVAREAAARGVTPEVVWHSGKLRGRQTAEACWRTCNPFASCVAVRGLLPGDPPEWLRDTVAGDPREIIVVGHMPHLPALLNLLTRASGDGAFPLHGAVALEADGARWIERWRIVLPTEG